MKIPAKEKMKILHSYFVEDFAWILNSLLLFYFKFPEHLYLGSTSNIAICIWCFRSDWGIKLVVGHLEISA